jgi:hypothetical protein
MKNQSITVEFYYTGEGIVQEDTLNESLNTSPRRECEMRFQMLQLWRELYRMISRDATRTAVLKFRCALCSRRPNTCSVP